MSLKHYHSKNRSLIKKYQQVFNLLNELFDNNDLSLTVLHYIKPSSTVQLYLFRENDDLVYEEIKRYALKKIVNVWYKTIEQRFTLNNKYYNVQMCDYKNFVNEAEIIFYEMKKDDSGDLQLYITFDDKVSWSKSMVINLCDWARFCLFVPVYPSLLNVRKKYWLTDQLDSEPSSD